MDTSIIEKEYNTVKRSLEAMGYKGILSTESTGLVNRILSDLIKATKAFKNMQTEKENVSAELKVQGDLVLPLRNENLKLAKENNELHRELIKIRDDLDLRNTSNSVALTKLQNENMELKFLLTQKDNAYKQIAIQNESLRNKLNKVFSKLYMGEGDKSVINVKGLPKAQKIISNTSPNQINLTYKKASFELSEKLSNDTNKQNQNQIPIDEFKEELSKFNLTKEDWANDLRVADREAEKLREMIAMLKNDNEEKNKVIDDLNRCLHTRDVEIKRLQDQVYLGEENNEEIKIKYKSEFFALQNEKLLNQIDFLNKENHRLNAIDYFHNHRCRQEEIKRLDDTIANLEKENAKLKKTLDRYNLNMDTSVLNTSTSFYKNNRSRLNQSSLFGVNLGDQIKKLRNEKKDLARQIEEEKTKVQDITKELMQSKDDLTNTKKDLQSTIDKLKKEIERLKGNNVVNSNENAPVDTITNVKAITEGSKDTLEAVVNENKTLIEKLKEKEKEIIDMITLNQKTNENYETQISKLKENLKSADLEIKTLKNTIEEMKSKAQMISPSSTREKELETENNILKSTNAKLSNENDTLRNQIKSIDSNCDTLNKEMEKKTERLTQMENDYKKVQSQLKILEDKLQTEINKETEQSNEYKKILLDRESEINRLTGEIGELKEYNNKLSDDIGKYQSQSSNTIPVDKEKEKLKKNLQIFANENKAAAEHIRKLKISLSNLEKVNSHLISELSKYQPATYEANYTNDID